MSWPELDFYRGTRDGALGHLLAAPLDEFRSWYGEGFLDSPQDRIIKEDGKYRQIYTDPSTKEEFYYSKTESGLLILRNEVVDFETIEEITLLPLIDQLMAEGAVALEPATLEQAQLVDELMDEFYWWCGDCRSDLLNEFTELWLGHRIWLERHYCTEEGIQKYLGDEAARLWEYMLYGRAVGRRDTLFPYKVRGEPPYEYYGAYWTFDEVSFLYRCLREHRQTLYINVSAMQRRAVEVVYQPIEAAFDEGVGIIIRV